MKSVNLIPAPRRDAKRRRRHRNVCALACGTYALALGCALGVAHLMFAGAAARLDEELHATDAAIERTQQQVDDCRDELIAARATIEANRTVAEQPDWSVLLALLAKCTGDDVVLRSVIITPPAAPTGAAAAAAQAAAKAGTPAPAPPAVPEFLLEVHGIGRSQLAVQQHVLRVEQTGLFAKVALLDTGREPYLEQDAIAFRLQCTFGEPKQPQPAQAGALTATDPAGGITK
jgi:hypothetical protein